LQTAVPRPKSNPSFAI